jgi:protein-S-isoprenylcysteine O-methyltransferase Ste14
MVAKCKSLLRRAGYLVSLLLSISGYVPQHATLARSIVMIASLAFTVYLGRFQPHNVHLAIAYFFLGTIGYVGFIYAVLSTKGLRHWYMRRWKNEEEGYLAYEASVAFLFYHNGASIGYMATATAGHLFHSVNQYLLGTVCLVVFVGGFLVKLWAAHEVTVDIYYWKDMFLGRKIKEFVVCGPYKYLSNPMYGVGQLQGYAFAAWYGSWMGLLTAFVNQALVFSFYYAVEKKFIRRTYGHP